jgi:hypothetical protein
LAKPSQSKRALDPEPREIDYRIRPAKNVERKMLLEICSRMSAAEDVANYRYVGMGSIYFVDFELFHRAFGIESMISIEGRENLTERCEWNRPFDCIEVRPTTVERALPELRSDTPTIMWLDYEERLDAPILSQVAEACEILAPRSILIVTVNASPDPSDSRVDNFRRRFGNRDVGRVNKPAHIGNVKLRELNYEYLTQSVSEAIENRAHREDLQHRQLAHFAYKDGARMLTVAWLIHERADTDAIDRCGFDRLSFASTNAKPFEIEVPRLTYRERLALDRLLPEGKLDERPASIGEVDAAAYSLLYRQMPIYVDAVI